MNIYQLIAGGNIASLMDAIVTNDEGFEEQKTVEELIAAFPQYAASLAKYNVGDIMTPAAFLYSIDPEMYQIVSEQSEYAFRIIDAANAEIDPELEAMMPQLMVYDGELLCPPTEECSDCSRQVSNEPTSSAGDGAMFQTDDAS